MFEDNLATHEWPGNIRELYHVVCRAAILEGGPDPTGYPLRRKLGAARRAAARSFTRNASDAREALARFRGNKSLAAKHLGVSRKTLYLKLQS